LSEPNCQTLALEKDEAWVQFAPSVKFFLGRFGLWEHRKLQQAITKSEKNKNVL